MRAWRTIASQRTRFSGFVYPAISFLFSVSYTRVFENEGAAVTEAHWTFFSNYAHVLVCLAESPEATLREVADQVGITERSAQRIITHLAEAGILLREKSGRRNTYVIDTGAHLRHPLEEHCTVGELLKTILSSARVRRLDEDHANYNARVSS
jgi:predicted transcriptional regulator